MDNRDILVSLALSSPKGLSLLFYRRIQSFLTEHATDELGEVMPFYWEKEVGRFVLGKFADKTYDSELQQAFGISGEAKVDDIKTT